MINIVVFNEKLVDIEGKSWEIKSKEDMIKFLVSILNSAYYTGETLCLEEATITERYEGDCPTVTFVEIDRWR